jgi:hypothetical protein
MVKDKIKPLEHLQPKLIAGALYIHNGKDIQDKIDRTHQVQRIVGDKLATYVMALLVLPQLMEQVMKSDDFTTWSKNYKTQSIH